MERETTETEPQISITEILRNWFRAMAALFGIFLILMGLYFASQLFGLGYAALTNPERFGPVIDQWTEYFGGPEPIIDPQGELAISPRVFVFVALGGIVLVMLALTTSVITTGARIVYWMGTDLDAVKRVLSSVFGPSTVQVIKSPPENRAKPFDHPDSEAR